MYRYIHAFYCLQNMTRVIQEEMRRDDQWYDSVGTDCAHHRRVVVEVDGVVSMILEEPVRINET